MVSRRLGTALGVITVPFKTCTYDCIYCPFGGTGKTTLVRAEYLPAKEIWREVKEALEHRPALDYVILTGNGEPTLNSRLGRLVSALQEKTDYKVAVLTNSSLLWDGEVQGELLHADLVLASLDAFDAKTFQQVNRPHPEISFERMLNGLIEFRRVFSRRLWLEIQLIEGLTGLPSQIEAFAELVKRIGPDKVELNTGAPTAAGMTARPIPHDRIQQFGEIIQDATGIIVDCDNIEEDERFFARSMRIVNLLREQPGSVEEIASRLRVRVEAIQRHLQFLAEHDVVLPKTVGGATRYFVKHDITGVCLKYMGVHMAAPRWGKPT